MKRFFHSLVDGLGTTINYLLFVIPLSFLVLGILQMLEIEELFPYLLAFGLIYLYIQNVIDSYRDSK